MKAWHSISFKWDMANCGEWWATEEDRDGQTFKVDERYNGDITVRFPNREHVTVDLNVECLNAKPDRLTISFMVHGQRVTIDAEEFSGEMGFLLERKKEYFVIVKQVSHAKVILVEKCDSCNSHEEAASIVAYGKGLRLGVEVQEGRDTVQLDEDGNRDEDISYLKKTIVDGIGSKYSPVKNFDKMLLTKISRDTLRDTWDKLSGRLGLGLRGGEGGPLDK